MGRGKLSHRGASRRRSGTDAQGASSCCANARKPLVVTGSGVLWSRAEEALRNFIDTTGIPFFTTPQGRGVIRRRPSRSFPAARSIAFREADVVLVIGARANSMLSFLRAPRFSPDARFINVNLDGREIGHNRAAEVGIIGDAKLVLEQLTAGGERPLQSAKKRARGSRNSPPSIAPTWSAARRCCIRTSCRFIRCACAMRSRTSSRATPSWSSMATRF